MTVSARPADVGRLARAVTAAGLGGLGLLVAAPAAHAVAVPPGVYVVDEAGVLSTSDEQRLTQEIQDLRRDTGQGLYVVYVDEFSTDAQTRPRTWRASAGSERTTRSWRSRSRTAPMGWTAAGTRTCRAR